MLSAASKTAELSRSELTQFLEVLFLGLLLMLVLAGVIGVGYGMGVESTNFPTLSIGPGQWQRFKFSQYARGRVEIVTAVSALVLAVSLPWCFVRCGKYLEKRRRSGYCAGAVLLLALALIVASAVGGFHQGVAVGKMLWPN